MWAHLLVNHFGCISGSGAFLGLPCSNLSDAPVRWFLEAMLAHFGEFLYIKTPLKIMKNLAQKDSHTHTCLNQF